MSNNDELISEIIIGMSDDLNSTQLKKLKDCLQLAFYNKTITDKCTEVTKLDVLDNYKYINRFVIDERIHGLSPKTIKMYEYETRKFLEYMNKSFIDITKDDITYYLVILQNKGISGTSLDNTRKYIKSFFTWACNNELIKSNPFDKVKNIKRNPIKKNVLTDYEITCMRDACMTKRELAVIDFLYASGVRVGECTGLKMNDIDFNTGRCTIFGEKTQEYRTIYLDSNALKHIIDYRNELSEQGKYSEYVFAGLRGDCSKRVSPNNIENTIKKVKNRCSITRDITVHTFRKTFADRLNKRKAPLSFISNALGHADSSTTTKYYIPLDDDSIKNDYTRYT